MGAFVNSKEKYMIPYDSLLHKVIDYDKESDYIGIEGELFLVKKKEDNITKFALYTGTLSGNNKQLTSFDANLNGNDSEVLKYLESYIEEQVAKKPIGFINGGELEDEAE